ncbi:hypothetical protein, partial [Methylobacter sp.]|uniref:hypothetical protein n=1 Tax=Methylobacter sp. TaxID=2051955 RepID=UPI00248723BA
SIIKPSFCGFRGQCVTSVIKYNGTQITQMNKMSADNYKYSEITEKIINAFYKGYNTLGYGFLERSL